jgi:hypothetical protein
MASRQALAAVSAAQLVSGIAGQVVALRRGHPYDIPVLSGRPGSMVRDSLLMGTALSAPVHMLATQAWAVGRLAAGPDERARQVLRVLGTVMVAGYLLERLDRKRLTPAGFESVETPVVVSGLGLAAAMAVLARPVRRAPQSGVRP